MPVCVFTQTAVWIAVSIKLVGVMIICSMLGLLCRLGLVSRFFQFLSLEHSNNNVHNIRLCRLIILNADLSSQDLADLQVADKVCFLFKFVCLLMSMWAHHSANGSQSESTDNVCTPAC